MPGCSGVTVVTMLVCFVYFAREAAGALRARHSLRPLSFEDKFFANLVRIAPGNADVCLPSAVIARERGRSSIRDACDRNERPQRTGYSAFAEYDDR